MKWIIFFVLLLVLTTMIPLQAIAADVFATGNFHYVTWSSDYGLKGQTFRIDYFAEEAFSTSTQQYVRRQDFIMWRSCEDIIWPPYIGNGTGSLLKVELIDSAGAVKATQWNSQWSNGTYGSYLHCSDSLIYTERRNINIQASPPGVYRIKAYGTHHMPANQWTPPGMTGEVISNSF